MRWLIRCALVLSVVCPVAAQSPLDRIVGPVIPLGQSPWPWYDKAHQGNADAIIPAALSAIPQLGAKATGTVTLADGCPITVTGPAVREFTSGDAAMLAWPATDGPGTGHFLFNNTKIAGDVMTSGDRCGLAPGLKAASGLSLYHCEQGCRSSFGTYHADAWGLNAGRGAASWNYYDTGLALYRLYLRTNNPTYLEQFRQFTDLWWTWALDQGSTGFDYRATSFVSQFVRALDGKPERLPALHAHLALAHKFNVWPVRPPNWDAREAGYLLLNLAVGARADSDPTRRADYCRMIRELVPQWIASQRPEGYWSEKNFQYAYRPPGTSPWRMFAPIQGLARAFDAISDATLGGCHDLALAPQLLATITKAVDYTYLHGRSDNRGVFYDTEYPNAGQEGTNAGTQPGSVSIALGSASVTGTGTQFLTTFSGCVPNTHWIGIWHEDGSTWTYQVASCQDDTHLTIVGQWGDQLEKTAATGRPFFKTANAPTNCGQSKAKTCWPVDGDRNNVRELIWAHGWLYNQTKNPIYETRGDELFSAAYGGPAAGPGDRYPQPPGACGGPHCDGFETDYSAALIACAKKPSVPCNASTDYAAGNPYVFFGKRWGQGSGIGGADNYLAWRLDAAPCAEDYRAVTISGAGTNAQWLATVAAQRQEGYVPVLAITATRGLFRKTCGLAGVIR